MDHADRVLNGACNLMVCPIHVVRAVATIDLDALDKILNGLRFFWIPIFTCNPAGLPGMPPPRPRAATQPPHNQPGAALPPGISRFDKIAAEVSGNSLVIQQLVRGHFDVPT